MMKIKIANIFSLSALQRTPGKIVSQAKDSREPVIITQHGRPAVVMLGVNAFEEFEAGAVRPPVPTSGKEERKALLEKELERISSEIVAKYDPIKIILFGSLASGDVKESSDIDIVIIKDTRKRFWDRQKELAKIVRPKLACDVFVYTPKEWAAALKEKIGFATYEVSGKGRVIYDKAA